MTVSAALTAGILSYSPASAAALTCLDAVSRGSTLEKASLTPWLLQTPFLEQSPYLKVKIGNKDRQWLALNRLTQDLNLPANIRGIAKDKIRYFKEPKLSEADALVLKAGDERTDTLYAIDYVLRSFQTPWFDTQFRRTIIDALAEENLSGPEALEILLPIARGAKNITGPESVQAAYTFSKIATRVEIKRTASSSRENGTPLDPHELLQTVAIEKIESLGGGVNDTVLVRLKGGTKAVYKSLLGEYGFLRTGRPDLINFTREISAEPIIEYWLKNSQARKKGKSRLVIPPIVEAVLNNKGQASVGSLQLFQEGYVTLLKFMQEQPEAWKRLSRTLAWYETEARTRAIDYLLGNHDRFPNSYYRDGNYKNVMIKYNKATGDFEVALIDNAQGRPGQPYFGIENAPLPEHIPADLAESVLQFAAMCFASAFENVLPKYGIDDFLNRISLLQKRLRSR